MEEHSKQSLKYLVTLSSIENFSSSTSIMIPV